jgi:arginine repressor
MMMSLECENGLLLCDQDVNLTMVKEIQNKILHLLLFENFFRIQQKSISKKIHPRNLLVLPRKEKKKVYYLRENQPPKIKPY